MSIFESDLSIAIPASAHTLDGFRAWFPHAEYPRHSRISLINGEVIVDFNRDRIESHGQVLVEIESIVATLVHDIDFGKCYPGGIWLTNDEVELSTEPDCMFASWETINSKTLRRIPLVDQPHDGIELRGTPDWVLEIVGPSSVRKDTELLPAAYYGAGVKEFWLVDARDDNLTFDLFVRGNTQFQRVEPLDGWRTSQVFHHQFQLTREVDPVGGWEYTLRVR